MALSWAGWTGDDFGDLIWLTALVPAFLLSYYRGWQGATLALAAGMAAIAVTHVILLSQGATLPPEAMLWTVGALIVVGLGAGILSTALHSSRVEAERQARIDPGTGLPNRRRALLELESSFRRARRGAELATVLFDLDHFKRVNDRYGHATGDEVLLEVARILEERTRRADLSARVGGEEFLSILHGADVGRARDFAEEIRAAIAEVDFAWGTVTASAGIAVYEPGMASPDVLLAAADQALYGAKQQGRDRVAVAGEGRRHAPGRQLAVEAAPRLERSPGGGELILVVDDDDAARRSVAKALRRFGYEVLEAPGPEPALQIIRGLDQHLDLVMTDVIMPGMSGFRLVGTLMESHPWIRVVYMSGYMGEDFAWSGAPGRVQSFLRKPVGLDELSSSVRRILDEPLEEDVDGATAEPVQVAVEERASARRTESTPILVLATDRTQVSKASIRLTHLGYSPLRSGLLDDEIEADPAIPLMVVWLEPPFEAALDQVADLRSRWPSGEAPPLLLLAPSLPEGLARRWGSLFPVSYLPSDLSLPELELHVEHLRRVHDLQRERSREREAMEARVQARKAELQSSQRDLLIRLARTAELRDDLTGHHAERVGNLAASLAAEMGLPRDMVAIIGQVAPLHDLGKIAVPDAILHKPGALTATERQIMERHTRIGALLLSGSRHPLLQEAERIALSHHEWWNGEGYPQGLEGREIPLSARIVAVADVFDSVSHTRPYREASSRERALSIVLEGQGEQFDPDVVHALRALDRRNELATEGDPSVVARPDVSPMSPVEIREILEEFRRFRASG
jgi:putative two-component system response regulator